jgi:hypothetical protein
MATDPNAIPAMSAPMSSHPNGVRSWRNGVAASVPHPTAANSNRPAARHPDVLGARSRRDYLPPAQAAALAPRLRGRTC